MTITVSIPTVSGSGRGNGNGDFSSSYTSSTIRCSPLSQPPVYAPTRTPSPLPPIRSNITHDHSLHTGAEARPIPLSEPRRLSNHASPPSARHATRHSISPFASGSNIRSHPLAPSSPYSTPITPDKGGRHNASPQATPSPPLSRSHPLLGSYPLSLLHSRMSHAHAPHLLTEGFSLRLSAVGKGKMSSPHLRSPDPLSLPFSATYYDLENPELGSSAGVQSNKQTPWVGTIDVEGCYFSKYSSATSSSSESTHRIQPPSFPGYQVAPRGQLQILVTTPAQAVRVFIIPYDLRTLPVGGRLLVREKSFVQNRSAIAMENRRRSMPNGPLTADPQSREALRYAVQLQFCCVPALENTVLQETSHDRGASTTRQRRVSKSSGSYHSSSTSSLSAGSTGSFDVTSTYEEKAYYISKSIRVIFTSSPLESSEELRVERTDEMVAPSTDILAVDQDMTRGRRVIGFSPGSIGTLRGEEWEMVKRKWAARRAVESHDISAQSEKVQEDITIIRTRSPEPSHVPHLDIPSKIERPQLGNRGPSLLSVTSPSNIRIGLRPNSPTSPTISASTANTTTSPLPLISPLPMQILSPRPTRPTSSNTVSRPSAPLSPRQETVSPHPPVVWSPASLRRARREDVLEEKELSERLRKLGLSDPNNSQEKM